MRAIRVILLWSLLLWGSPVRGQSLCERCLTTAQQELKKCLEAAISHEDKQSCLQKQEVRSNACENGECKIEKTPEATKGEAPPETK